MISLVKRIDAIKKAKKRSQDLEFKKVWEQHLKVLVAKNKK